VNTEAPILAEVYRGRIPESRHRGRLVIADAQGRVHWSTLGDLETPVFFRSAMKPLQALTLVESGAADRFGLTGAMLALACASHSGDAVHVRVARAMLRRSPQLTERCLQCGVQVPYSARAAARLARAGKKPPVLCHNCSGKHIGLLLTCVHRAWPVATYLRPSHPVQREIKRIVREFTDANAAQIQSGRDGCNLPAHAVGLRRMAMAYARLAAPDYWRARGKEVRAGAVGRLTSAMQAHPLLVSGEGRADWGLMGAAGGRVFSKIGAEGVWCMGFPQSGLGLALKIEDGANRAEIAIVAAVLRQAALLPAAAIRRFVERVPRTISSSDGTPAGHYAATVELVRRH
jgi:L-asparaginase II